VDISEVSENRIGKPCDLKYLVFLVNSLDEAEKDRQRMELTVEDVNDELLEKLRSLAGGEVQCRRFRNSYALSFYPKTESPSALELDRLCRNCGIWLLDIRRPSEVKPDYHSTPGIQQIPLHVATMELLKELQNDFRSTPGQAFLELASLLEGVECYRLSLGKLDGMAKHVCDLMSSSEHRPDSEEILAACYTKP
jgi:hypothetical protein